MSSNNNDRTGLNWLGSLGVLLALIALWWVASNAGWVSRVFLPTPQATFSSLLEGLNLSGEGVDSNFFAVRSTRSASTSHTAPSVAPSTLSR